MEGGTHRPFRSNGAAHPWETHIRESGFILPSIKGGLIAQGQPGLKVSLCKVKIMGYMRVLQHIHRNLTTQVMNHVSPHMEVIMENRRGYSEETKMRISSVLTLNHLLLSSYTHFKNTTERHYVSLVRQNLTLAKQRNSDFSNYRGKKNTFLFRIYTS